MSLKFTIKGKRTPDHGECPCDSCTHSIRIRGRKQDDDIRYCGLLRKALPFLPETCDGYAKHGEQSLWDFQQLAWNLLQDKRGNEIGFRSPSLTRVLVREGKATKPDDVSGNDIDFD